MSRSGQAIEAPAAIVVGRVDLDAGVWFEAHVHKMHQLAWAAHGVLSVRAQDRTWVLPPGLALWIPARLEHATGAATAADMLAVYLHPRRSPIDWDEPVVVAISPLARELLTHLLREELPASTRAHAEALLFEQLHPAGKIQLGLSMPTEARARAVAEAVVAEPADRRSLEAWGRVVGASSRTLTRSWSAETGLGFAQWRTRARVQAALPLLAAGTAVGVVARQVGYETPSAFVAAFRREVGVPPGSYFAPAG